MSGRATSPPLGDLPLQPGGENGPVFTAPWEASAFAMVVKLSEAGHFTWPEWVECFSTVIAEHEHEHEHEHHHQDEHHHHDADHDHDAADAGTEYYHLWFEALERMLTRKNILGAYALEERHQYLRDNPVPHDHVARREPVCIA